MSSDRKESVLEKLKKKTLTFWRRGKSSCNVDNVSSESEQNKVEETDGAAIKDDDKISKETDVATDDTKEVIPECSEEGQKLHDDNSASEIDKRDAESTQSGNDISDNVCAQSSDSETTSTRKRYKLRKDR